MEEIHRKRSKDRELKRECRSYECVDARLRIDANVALLSTMFVEAVASPASGGVLRVEEVVDLQAYIPALGEADGDVIA